VARIVAQPWPSEAWLIKETTRSGLVTWAYTLERAKVPEFTT